MHPKKSFVLGRLKSMGYGLDGFRVFLMTQHSSWIHLMILLLLVISGFALRITAIDWCWIVLCITVMWVTEILNTSIEFVADAVTTDQNPLIGRAKDLGAAAVLFSVAGAFVICSLVLGPYINLHLGAS
jgi:diacylglycerol kinase